MMVAQTQQPRLQTMLREQIAPKLMQEFGLKNPHQVPTLTKIVVTVGVGRHLETQKLKPDFRDTILSTLSTISGQRPVMVKARQSVANFKVREGAPSAFMVTMRRERMWNFLDRLINLAMPRIKDFRGVSDKSFDPAGNYAFGLTEQAVWPEINMANVSHTHGMNINLVFNGSTPGMSRMILAELGFPFANKEDGGRR
ncbi:MAG: 50S ribosomal protein L5 [Planctomycetota bacterium]|nr:50S ribosomal protein L5 [Planctomycetota bacterium]